MLEFFKKRKQIEATQTDNEQDTFGGTDREQIEYALLFEKMISNIETQFRNSVNYDEIGIHALQTVCEFYGGDWAGIILAELDVSIWRPHWWCRLGDIDRTGELVHEFESSVGLERWVQCIRNNEQLTVLDTESIKDDYPVEYKLYKRLRIDSFIAVSITPKPTGCLVVRNPTKFINQTSFLKVLAYIIGRMIVEARSEESRKMMVAPENIQNPNEIVIKLFGHIEIYTARGVLYEEQIRSPKLCRLLVHLLLSRKTLHQPLSLANVLWSDEEWDNDKISSNIRGLVYRFRKQFQLISDYDLIINTQAGYRLNPDSDYEQFEHFEKEACHAPGKVRRMELIKQAVKLYKGEFFASGNAEGNLQSVARNYTMRYMHLINEILVILAEVGDVGGVHHYAKKGVEFAPENVKAHFWLIHSSCCGAAPELTQAELQWSKEHLTNEEYQDLLELLEKTKSPEMTINVKI